jgi:UDP-N-acetylglucosamine--N-acetylmuramyl-(pentapeptide) pyrophosphoryl-undecaprenol N-acetylglucosamine transferase
MDKKGINMIVAGGGTGGHLFPGVAVAEELLRQKPDSRVLFIGTNRGIEKRVLGGMGFALKTIDVEGIKGRGILKIAASLLKIPGSIRRSFQIIREFKPDVVAGVGGYASGPAVLAAKLMGIRTVIAEQNAVPGLTNRILGRFVDRIFVTFAASGSLFPVGKTVVTGNPVRSAFLSGTKSERGQGHPFTVLVFGGSQGAAAINRAALAALAILAPLKDDLLFIHQTGERDRQAVDAAYREQGFQAEVHAFIGDMAETYGRADLLVCRAGATSIAEITAMGKATVFIPLPTAAGDHQTKNALLLADAGAAAVIPEKELDGSTLAAQIERLYRSPEEIRKMERAAASLGRRDAAAAIVKFICDDAAAIERGCQK